MRTTLARLALALALWCVGTSALWPAPAPKRPVLALPRYAMPARANVRAVSWT